MIDLDPDDDHALLRETAARFAGEHLAGAVRDAEAARAVAARVRAAYAEIGLAGLELPEASGGAGLGAVARVLVNEELAAGDVGAALALDPLGMALYPLLEMAGGGETGRLLARWSADPAARLLLVGDADGDVALSGDTAKGRVGWVAAERADALVVLAGDRCVLVAEGIGLEPVRGAGLRAAGGAELRFEGPVAASFEDAEGARRALARARLYVASLMLGSMRAAWEFACAYSQEREAFGRPIGHHQALAFLLTDMRMALDGARLLVHEAAWRIDAGAPAIAAAASAYAQCIATARTLGPDAVQVLGGHGFMADYPVEKHMRELRALGLWLGGFDRATEEAGRLYCAEPEPLALARAEAL